LKTAENADILGPGLIEWIPQVFTGRSSKMNVTQFELGVVAHVTRSETPRSKLRAHTQLLEILDDNWIAMLIRLLDEHIIIIHPKQHKGFEFHMSGLPTNFDLFELISKNLVGNPEEGWLTTDQPDGVYAFNQWNWTGLLPDGTLPDISARSDPENDIFDKLAFWRDQNE
jgi:hypothetical protein